MTPSSPHQPSDDRADGLPVRDAILPRGGPRRCQARVAQLRDLAAQGLCKADAARAAGITGERVRQIANREGIAFEQAPKFRNALARQEEATALAKTGLTALEIADRLHTSAQNICLDLRMAGVKARHGLAGRCKYLPALHDAQERGLSQAELAGELGIHRPSISRLCKRHGITLRDGRSKLPGRK